MRSLALRPEFAADHAVIRSVHEAAFGRSAEADLVDAVRREGDLVLSLVAVESGDAVGHVAFSRLVLPEADVRACALAPLAVIPLRQRQGIGAALVRDSIRLLAAEGEDLVLVLGEPAYYGRFGFRPETAQGLRTPYDGRYLQALALTEPGRAAAGPVHYAPAFARLS